jgi:hypothetical protein
VAIGVDRAERFLLTVSHSGRGVFSTGTWERVARCREVVYPADGWCTGIGPLAGVRVRVVESYDGRPMRLTVAGWDVVADGSNFTLTRQSHDTT